MATTSELLDQFVDLFNGARWSEMEAFYAPGAISEEIGPGRRMNAVEATENSKAWRTSFPDANGRITSRVVDGDRGAAEIVWTGTQSGPLGPIPASGRKVDVRAVVVIEAEGGRAARIRHYLDFADLLRQVGALPA